MKRSKFNLSFFKEYSERMILEKRPTFTLVSFYRIKLFLSSCSPAELESALPDLVKIDKYILKFSK
jgi:hypothetical protein